MTAPLVVFGAGGHGKVVCDALLANGETVLGFIDDAKAGQRVLGLPVLGGAEWIAKNDCRVALGIGDNALRARVFAVCTNAGVALTTVIHRSATVARSAALGAGVVVMANAVINAEARVEDGAIVNTGAIIEHDCVVEVFAHVSPNACMAGGCRLGARGHLGVGASMLPGTTIGEATIVGGGAVVTRDIAGGVVAAGVPARRLR